MSSNDVCTMTTKELIEKLRAELPPVWDRLKTGILTGGAVAPNTLANHMVKGQGPKAAFRMGRKKVIIEREAFLAWLEERITSWKDREEDEA